MYELGPALFDLLNAKQWVGAVGRPPVYGRGGLAPADVAGIERQLGFPLPDDFAYLLANVRDPGQVLFPWADFSKERYDALMEWVLEGVLRTVGRSGYWLKAWGERPEEIAERVIVVRQNFPNWPKLLPIYGHRFLAAEPCQPGNPVFSIMHTDIIYYGANLADYLVTEFIDREHRAVWSVQPIRRIPIWSDFVEGPELPA